MPWNAGIEYAGLLASVGLLTCEFTACLSGDDELGLLGVLGLAMGKKS